MFIIFVLFILFLLLGCASSGGGDRSATVLSPVVDLPVSNDTDSFRELMQAVTDGSKEKVREIIAKDPDLFNNKDKHKHFCRKVHFSERIEYNRR